VAHVCNPSYSGGRDQEDRTVQSQSQVKSLWGPISEKPTTKKRQMEWLKV
jgi:hypothetical protein